MKLPLTDVDLPRVTLEKAISQYLRPPECAQNDAFDVADNVEGVGLGFKMVSGKATSAFALRFYVGKKVRLSEVPRQHLLPREFAGLPTDVIDIGGRISALSGRSQSQKRLRPIQPGCSISFHPGGGSGGVGSAGTLGAIVQLDDGRLGLLSNNHVLSNVDRLPSGTIIVQPGVADGGKASKDQIGVLERKAPWGGNLNLDCAVAVVVDKVGVNPRWLGPYRVESGELIQAEEGMRVWKYGRTTRLTEGVVDDALFACRMRYQYMNLVDGEAQLSTEWRVLQGQMGIRRGDEGNFDAPLTAEGDSGALIIERETGRPTGLLLGGTAKYIVANHLSPVLEHLKVKVITG